MRLLILGTGNMAATHARAFAAIRGVDVAACVDVDGARARKFAKDHGIRTAYDDFESALSAGGIDAVANTTPDSAHYETTMTALAAGCHVFCEKPLATNAAHAREMADAARATGGVAGVNLTYRNVAALEAARDIVASGRIGECRHFEAAYLQSWLTQDAWGDWRTDDTWLWRLSREHGSLGALGDIGIHIIDFVTYAAGASVTGIQADLATFSKAPNDRIGAYVLDANDSFTMAARLSNGAAGVIHATRFAPGHMNDLSLRLFGTKGGLEVTNAGPLGTIRICADDDVRTAAWSEVALDPVPTNYERFAEAVALGHAMEPGFDTAAALQEVIDRALDQGMRRG